MSNIISFLRPSLEAVMPSTSSQESAVCSSGAGFCAIWVTDHLARRVQFSGLVREIDASSFFADKAMQEIESVYGAALKFLDNLMEDLIFWESL